MLNISHLENLNNLVDSWKDLNTSLFTNSKLDIEEFKSLFFETWRYLISSKQTEETLQRSDMELLTLLSPIIWYNDVYPSEIGKSQFDACICFVKGLLTTIS